MAARSLGVLTLDLVAKIGGFTGPMDKAGRTAEYNAKRMEAAAKKSAEEWKKLGKTAAVALSGLAVAGVAKFIAETKAAEQEQAQLAAVLKSTGEAAGFSLGTLNEMADVMEAVSTFSGGEINEAQTALLAFTGIVGAEFPRALQAATDMAARTGSSVVQAAETIGRALDVPSQGMAALSKQGFRFTDDQKEIVKQLEATGRTAEAQGIILKALEDTYGGAAKAARDTFGGSLSSLNNTISYLLTGSDGSLANATQAVNDFNDVLRDPATKEAVDRLGGSLATLAGGAVTVATEFADLGDKIGYTLAYLAGNLDEVIELNSEIKAIDKALNSGTFSKPIAFLFTSDGELKKQREQKVLLLETLTGIKEIPPANDAVRKSLDGLIESSGLFSGIAAGVEELTAAEIAAALAGEQLVEKNKKAAAAMQANLEKTEAGLLREIALHGNLSGLLALEYDLRAAGADFNSAGVQRVLNLQKEKDTLDAAAAAGDEAAKALRNMDVANGDLANSAAQLGDIYTGTFERISGYGSDMLYGLATDSENAFGGIAQNFTRMISEMANEALLTPILLNIQQGMAGNGGGSLASDYTGAAYSQWASSQSGGAAAGGASGSGAMGAIGAGGMYAIAAVAVVAAVNSWNKEQDEKFLKMTAEYRQGTQSTGTLLGMANAKSESIGNLLEDMSGQYDDVLSVNYGMYRALLDIRTGIAGVASGFARSIGLSAGESVSGIETGTSAMFSTGLNNEQGWIVDQVNKNDNKLSAFTANWIQALSGKIDKELFKQKITISDSGIEFLGSSLQDIIAGGMVDAVGYIDITSEKKIFGVSLGKKLKTETSALDDLMISQITGVFEGAGEALKIAAGIFGLDFEANLAKLLIDPQKLSLKDLEGDALAKEIEAFFSSTLDNWAGVLLDGTEVLRDFQQVGEGAFETMLRLASETNQLGQMLEFIGQSFGSTGLDAIYLTQQLADLAGGFDVLTGNLGTYYDKFFTDQEKLANLTGQLSDATGGLLDVLPTTHAEFRNIIEALDKTTEAGAAAFVELIALSPAMHAYLTALEREGQATANLTGFMRTFVEQIDKANLSDFAAAVYDLNNNLAAALKSAEELGASEEDLALIRRASAYDMLDLQRGQTDSVLANLRKSIDAEIDSQASIYASAVDELAREFDARVVSLDGWLETQLNHFERRSKTLGDSIRDLSSLSNALGSAIGVLKIDSEQLRNQRFFDATDSLSAMAAGVSGGGALPNAETITALAANLNNGQDFFSTFEDYAMASATALNDIALLKGVTDTQLTTDEKMLASIERSEQTARDNHERMLTRLQADREKEQAALDKNHEEQLAKLEAQYQTFVAQVEVLRGINNSVATVEQAVAAMNEAIATELEALRQADNDKYDEMIAALEAIAVSTGTSATIARTEQLEAAEAA